MLSAKKEIRGRSVLFVGVDRVKELGKESFCLFIKNISSWRCARSGLPTDVV